MKLKKLFLVFFIAILLWNLIPILIRLLVFGIGLLIYRFN